MNTLTETKTTENKSSISHEPRYRSLVPATSVAEDEQGVRVLLQVPGATKEQVNLTVERGILSIEAKTAHELPEGMQLTHREFSLHRRYSQQFRLAEGLDTDHIDASLANGILTIRIAKKAEAQARKIEIKPAE